MVAQLDPFKPALGFLLAAIVFGWAAAWLRARGRARWLAAVDALLLFPALIPAPIIAGALLPAFQTAANPKWTALLVAMAVVAAPLAYLPVRLALVRVDRSYRNTASLLGLGAVGRMLRIELPLAWPALLLGALLATARMLGELAAAVGAIERFTIVTAVVIAIALVASAGVARIIVQPAALR
jgi:ABC-type spermidine/putrescine transport system permease subunit II